MNSSSNDLNFLLQEKTQACDRLSEDYQEMKDLNSQIEKELEAEIDQLTKEKKRVIEQKDTALRQIQELRQKHSKETSSYEKALERMENENSNLKQDLKAKNQVIIRNEIEIEQLESQLRESQSLISDLESRIELTLERLTIIHTQLEETKLQNEEEVERLKERLRESQSEVMAYQIKEASKAGETAIVAEGQNAYFDAMMQHYDTYQANGGDDPFPHKILKLELGKRSYKQLSYESKPQKMSNSQGSRQSTNIRLRNGRSAKEGEVFGNSLNLRQNDQNNALQWNSSYQNDMHNLHSLNVMNKGFSKSLFMVNSLIEDLDKQPAINYNANTSYNFNPNNQINTGLFNPNNENNRMFNQSFNGDSNFSNISKIFGNNNFSRNGFF